jgi:hypothetical protein
MAQQEHIAPPPELIEDWIEIAKPEPWKRPPDPNVLCTLAAQWGADQELDACCDWFQEFYKTESWVKHDLKHFRDARRPKPPSLREQALQAAQRFYANGHEDCNDEEVKDDFDIIRRALESLPD